MTDVVCPNNCRDPQGRTMYMKKTWLKFDILNKEYRPTLQCSVCRRWVFNE